MSSRRQRPTAFEVSFPEEATAFRTASAQASGSRPTKRKFDEEEDHPQTPQPRSLPSGAYYNPLSHGSVVKVCKETGELALLGEGPDFGDAALVNERKPIRVLTNFAIFDRRHSNEMVPLNILETEDMNGRDIVVVGYARAYFEEQDSEDGQEDDLEGDEAVLLRLSTVLRYTLDYLSWDDPVYIETQWAWYMLSVPSNAYAPFYQYFLSPKLVAQMVISTASTHPRHTLQRFLEKFTETVDPFGHTYVLQDLWDAAPEIYEVLQEYQNFAELRATPLINSILERFHPASPKRKRRDSTDAPRTKQIPANRLIGNPDLSTFKAENQNPTQVTPRIAALAMGHVPETLRVVGKPLPQPNKDELERNRLKRRRRISELINNARKTKKDIRWEKADRIVQGSQYLKRIFIEGETYNVGDIILVPNDDNPFWESPGQYNEALDVPPQATIADFFWFGKIHSINQDSGKLHFQWFEHGNGIFLREMADEQQLYLVNMCTDEALNAIVGKVEVQWKAKPGQPIDLHQFSCNYMYDGEAGSFYDINPDDFTISAAVRPPDNCPSCILFQQKSLENGCMKTKDKKGLVNGFTYLGKKYHYADFIYFYSVAGPANIGLITEFRVGNGDSGTVICKKVGRIADLGYMLPSNILRDERHLFVTEEIVKVDIKDLLGVLFVPCLSSLQECVAVQEWIDMAPDHFFIKYRFPTCRPTNWNQRRLINWDDHDVCIPCWEEKISEVKTRKTTTKELQNRPLKTIDLYGGVGAFSQGLAEGSEALKITHAIELAPSAAKTFKLNSPETVVYNQCANTMLQYTIKTWEGHEVKAPYQLYDEKVVVPAPPAKGEIKVIVAGFPCQAYSGMNNQKRANDVKSNLFLNALSWVDVIRPWFAFFENVTGFLQYRLGGVQAGPHRIEGGIEMGGVKLLVRAMLDMGYQIRFSFLQAAHYGTPQGRIRFFMVAALKGHPLPDLPQPSHHFDGTALEIKVPYGIRNKVPIKPIRVAKGTALHPTVTIDSAISDLPRFDWTCSKNRSEARYEDNKLVRTHLVPWKGSKSFNLSSGFTGSLPYHHEPKTRFQMEVRSTPTTNLQHFTRVLGPHQVRRVVAIPLKAKADYRSLAPKNQEWQLVNPQSYMGRNNFRAGAYGRLDKNSVFRTIVTNVSPTAKQSWVLNPYCKRMLTVRELARAQGFPDSFVFESIGNRVLTMHRQIGNAVPFPLARALGRQLRLALLEKWTSGAQNAIQIEDEEDGSDSDIAMRNLDDDYRSETSS